MPITEKFSAIPSELFIYDGRHFKDVPATRDPDASSKMRDMSHHMINTPESTYGWGSWGFTILRTVYDDESDALFHPTVDKLRRWMVEYWLHYGRISGFGEEAQASAEKMSNGSVNEALGERLRFEIVEDKDRLDVPDPEKATVDEIQVLCDRFHEWVAGVGEDPEAQPPASPRLCSFLAIDAKALADLASVPDEIPPLQVAVDFEEFIRRRYSAMYNGWAWIVDPRAVRRYREGVDLDPKHRGWMRIDPGLICSAWFLLVWLLMKGDGDGMIEGHENPKGSGRIFYSVSVF